ncbi:MAG: Asparagine synthase (Glutamine-hydrolyzing), partial [Bacteroidetes bacterium]|nr:Asparagine synthase (Glutamine-hydrolyzing) [Bacteroidota bacterium]
MCGIAGIFSPQGQSVDQSLLLRMTHRIRHRGPDDEGFLLADTRTGLTEHRRGSETIPEVRSREIGENFSGTSPNLGLGWRRLSIIDLSPSGHQPMSNADGTLWVIFNGEIYNYIELRVELKAKGYVFRTQSDTEVILHAYHAWGQDCLHHFNGMWGMAIWDVQKRQLFCARDRYGVKPFYYFWNGSSFAFASEIKALLELPWIPRRANDSAVYDFLVHRVLDHTEQTFFSDILQLRPGHCAFISERGLQVQRYYTLSYNPDLGHFNERDSIAHA